MQAVTVLLGINITLSFISLGPQEDNSASFSEAHDKRKSANLVEQRSNCLVSK